MGGRKAGFNTNRAEFMSENALDGDIEYQRTGGCFVTTKKAIVLALIAILALAAVGAVIYFYGTQGKKEEEDGSLDLEKLLNNSVNSNNNVKNLRLPSYIQPLHYRLRIHPYLDETNPNNFTFTGRVTITIQTSKPTKKIILHSEDLQILSENVKLSTTKDLRIKSLSQVLDSSLTSNASLNDEPSNTTQEEIPVISVNETVGEESENESNDTSITKAPEEVAPNINLFDPPMVSNNTASTKAPEEVAPNVNLFDPPMVSVPTVAPLFTNSTDLEPQTQIPITLNSTSSPTELDSSHNVSPISPNESSTNINLLQVNDRNNDLTTTSPKISTSQPTSTEYIPSPDSVYKTSKIININIKSQEEDKITSTYVIYLSAALQAEVNYTLDIQFSGKMLNNLVGFYKTSYVDAEDRKRWLATTQLKPTFARRVFPCFDEPSFRSSFDISLARRTNMITLSNMVLKETEPMVNQTGWMWDHYEKSPPMSTHMVAFTICDFESVNVGPSFKIWAPKQSLSNAQYATEIAPKILSYLQNYFDIRYPLPKIDFVAIPELARTATEDWGLISFRDSALLFDPSAGSWKTKNHIFKTIARELTTQWFGNLVTIDWWSELWLIEGFSMYMEDVVENAIDPELEDLDTFALRIMQVILDSDKLKSVRSLQMDVKDPAQIEQLFDDIASNKGSCLIRMLNYTMTEFFFKQGVQNYLKKGKFKSSNQNNFWSALTEVISNQTVFPSDLTVQTFMESWINQEGYPVVTVNRDYKTGNVLINQNRFVYGNSTHQNLWHIPLTYTRQTDNGAVSTMWLKQEEFISTVNFMEPGSNSWVIFNVEQSGFYRVNYDMTNWKLLQKQLLNDPGKIMPSNRGQILNDAFELANAGILDYVIPLELTKYLAYKERNFVPWISFYHSLQALEDVIGRTQYNGIFRKYIINMIKLLYDELGSSEKPQESQHDKLLRTFIIKMACSHHYEPCLKWAEQKYQEWMDTPEPDKNNPIPFDFREAVQCSAIKLGGQEEWEFLWQRTLHPLISPINLKLAYLTLGCTREPWLINRYLEKSLNGSIALQNAPFVWKSIAHPVGIDVGFNFLRSNWDRIYDKYELIFGSLKSIFEDFLSKLSTEVDLEDLTTFYKQHKKNLNPVSSLVLSVVDRLKWRIHWTELHMETIVTWLLENSLNRSQ